MSQGDPHLPQVPNPVLTLHHVVDIIPIPGRNSCMVFYAIMNFIAGVYSCEKGASRNSAEIKQM